MRRSCCDFSETLQICEQAYRGQRVRAEHEADYQKHQADREAKLLWLANGLVVQLILPFARAIPIWEPFGIAIVLKLPAGPPRPEPPA